MKNNKNIAIKIENLGVNFNDQKVIEDFSLTLHQGEKIILTGHSGCGKTTIFRTLLGFAPISEGKIFINGTQLTENNCWEVRKNFAYVSQAPFTGFGTAKEFLMAPFTFKANQHLKVDDKLILDYMEKFHLKNELLNKNSEELSGGEKQRFALIGAILLNKKIFLLDEPTAALDKRNRTVFNDYLLKNPEFSAIIITHDDELIKNSARVIDMTGGQNG